MCKTWVYMRSRICPSMVTGMSVIFLKSSGNKGDVITWLSVYEEKNMTYPKFPQKIFIKISCFNAVYKGLNSILRIITPMIF